MRKDCQSSVPSYSENIARIANAVQCHSELSGHTDCHELRFSIFRIVICVSNVTSQLSYISDTFLKNCQSVGHVIFPHHCDQINQRSQVSWVALCLSKVKVPSSWRILWFLAVIFVVLVRSEQPMDQGTRSPIELLWTAKKYIVMPPCEKRLPIQAIPKTQTSILWCYWATGPCLPLLEKLLCWLKLKMGSSLFYIQYRSDNAKKYEK